MATGHFSPRIARLLAVAALAVAALLVVVPVAGAAPLYTVDSTADAADATPGDDICETAATECTLRAAIQELNAGGDAGEIDFAIPTAIPLDDVATIQPATALPTIEVPTVIDGYSQPGASPATETDVAQIRVFLLGTTVRSVAPAAAGLVFDGNTAQDGGSTVKGLSIGDFGGNAMVLSSDENQVYGNFIGVLPDGSSVLRNRGGGVRIDGTTLNDVGGDEIAERNVISGNFSGPGVEDDGGEDNLVQGNVLGLDATGLARTDGGLSAGGNSFGVLLTGAAGDRVAGNVITGNSIGIQIEGGEENTIAGNRVGLDLSGNEPLGNGLDGIRVVDSPRNVIGGTAEADRNFVSANEVGGIVITGPAAAGNRILGNGIGSNVDGDLTALPGANPGDFPRIFGNRGQGIEIINAPDTVVGAPGAPNRIVLNGLIKLGTGAGVAVMGAGSTDTVIQANLIGMSEGGVAHMGNGANGVYIEEAQGTVLGGAGTDEGNVIVDTGVGVYEAAGGGRYAGSGVQLLRAAGTRIQGNRIGVIPDEDKTVYPNAFTGIEMHDSTDTLIGGTDPGAGNIISNNGEFGVSAGGLATEGLTIQGNVVGANTDGRERRPNATCGLVIVHARNVTIGGDEPGAGNLVAGNGTDGIELAPDVVNASVVGNLIGVQLNGEGANANGRNGLLTAADGVEIRDNVISANNKGGVLIESASKDAVFRDNRIGTNADGNGTLANLGRGIEIQAGAERTVIGGEREQDGNIISGNFGSGVAVQADGTRVLGNLIGTDGAGERPLPNHRGVVIEAADVDVGSLTKGEGNLIAFNDLSGVEALAGGDDADVLGNVISANGSDGVYLLGARARLLGNLIGTDPAGGRWLGNHDAGVTVGGADATIGTTNPGEGNRIAYNGAGVVVLPGAARNAIAGNGIDDNKALGIDLPGDGPTPNDAPDADGVQNFPEIASASSSATGTGTDVGGTLRSTPNASFTVDVYASPAADPSGYGEGAEYLGSRQVTTDASGVASWSLAVGRPLTGVVAATARSAAGDTSEFSRALAVTPVAPPPPVVDPPAPPPAPKPVVLPTSKTVTDALRAAMRISGSAGKLDTIRRSGGYATRFNAPAAGRVVIQWFATPKAAKKPVLVAQGRATASGKGRITVFVSLTKAGKKLLRATKGKLKLSVQSSFTTSGRTYSARGTFRAG